ncbi:MAG: hypothetical protein D6820_15520, partial [Lentisphaerae bacterium]
MDKQVKSAGRGNFSALFEDAAHKHPNKPGVLCVEKVCQRGIPVLSQRSFGQLLEDVCCYAGGLRQVGVKRGDRVLLFVTPGQDFLPLTFALLRIGAVPVLIDPGMGKRNLLRCVESVQARVMIGVPRAQVARLLFPGRFRSLELVITAGHGWYPWGGLTLDDIYCAGADSSLAEVEDHDLAAIIFTTGSTGPAKGVEYTHAMFREQTRLLRVVFDLTEDDVDMPAFALFSLFTLSMGCTVVIPKMDPTRPARAPAAEIVATAETCGVTFSFGSPAFWECVSRYCLEVDHRFSSLRKVILAGAPIPVPLHRNLLQHVLPKGGMTYTPYGATEALPISCFTGQDVLAETGEQTMAGKGYCVGWPLPGIEIRIVKIVDGV